MTMDDPQASERSRGRLYGILGVTGVIALGVSFAINQGPQPGATSSQLHEFALSNFRAVMLSGWLQCIGPTLLTAFVFGVLAWLPRQNSWLKSMTQFGMSVLMTVSLLEVALYFSALYSTPEFMTELSLRLISAVQHLYFIIAAPAVFLPFGFALIRLGFGWLGWTAVGLGAVFASVGCLTIFTQVLPNPVTSLGALQAIWWLTAALTVAVAKTKLPAQT
jgi:hypothetical protein